MATKSDLVEEMAKSAEISKTAANKALDALTMTITKNLKKGQSVTLTGFGTWSVKARKARQGRNPQTGETIKIKARKVPAFKAGKGLKDSVQK